MDTRRHGDESAQVVLSCGRKSRRQLFGGIVAGAAWFGRRGRSSAVGAQATATTTGATGAAGAAGASVEVRNKDRGRRRKRARSKRAD